MKVIAHLLSVIFHPLLMLTYMLLMMLVVNPYMFGYTHMSEANTLILMVFLTSALIPLIAILVMKGIGWVHSLQMPDKHERIGPYLVTSVLYLTLYLHFVKASAFPELLLVGTLGTVLVLFVGFVINNYSKISVHAAAAGGLLVLTWILYRQFSTTYFLLSLPPFSDLQVPTVYILYAAILLTGVICTARLISGNHTPGQVYGGFILGVLSMIVAYGVRM